MRKQPDMLLFVYPDILWMNNYRVGQLQDGTRKKMRARTPRAPSMALPDLTMKTKPVLSIVASLVLVVSCGNNKSFDSSAWLKADMRERGRMCEDLVKRKVLVGQSDDEARRLLGQPDKDYGSVLSYNVDLGWPMKDPKHYGLLVHLDQDRKVREVRIVD
jgi:hypothetical protein